MKKICSGLRGAVRSRLPLVGLSMALLLSLSAASASAETLLMPTREALMGTPVVVWGTTTLPNGSTFTMDFGDGTVTAPASVGDRSYIALSHTYTSDGNKLVTLTVTPTVGAAQVAIVVVQVADGGLLSAFDLRGVGINMAIQDGLRYLWTSQSNRTSFDTNSQTSWDGNAAFTSMVVLAFENHGFGLTNDNVAPTGIYQKYVVLRGLNFIFATLSVQLLDPQVGGNPCVGTGIEPAPCKGLRAYVYGNDGYATGSVALAVAGSGSLSRTVTSGAGAASGNANYNNYLSGLPADADYVVGRTYGELLQRLINTVAWGQGDSGTGRASWSYGLQSGGDGSTVGWNVLAMLDAAAGGATVPPWSITDFKNFALVAHSNKCASNTAIDGSFDYTADNNPCAASGSAGPNVGKTGIGLQGQFLAGTVASDVRVTDAVDWISDRWDGANIYPFNDYGCGSGTALNPGGSQNKGCAYMMFNAFKGLKLYGVTTLPGVGRPAGPGPIAANDWYADYQDFLVATQTSPATTGGGYWGSLGFSCCGGGNASAAALAELILSPVALVLPDPQLFSRVGLAPLTATNPKGTTHTVTAIAQSSNNTPVPGATVTFDVLTGPNSAGAVVCTETGTSANTTDINGIAPCTYVDAGGLGTDTIQAAIGSAKSNIVSKIWGDCSTAVATLSSPMYPLNHGLKTVTISGLVAPSVITGVCQDENPNFENIPAYAQDGVIVNAANGVVQVRAERSGTRVNSGNGRVYTIKFSSAALQCSGSVTVGVDVTASAAPAAINDGATWNSITGAASCP